MSRHLTALRDFADEDRNDIYTRQAAAAGVEHFTEVERQNRVMKKAINEAIRRNCVMSSDSETGERYNLMDHLKTAQKEMRRKPKRDPC